MKKKLLASVLIGVMTFSMTACGGAAKDTAATNETESTATEAAEETAQSASSEISTVTPGKLTVATSPDFAPYEFYAVGEDGTPKLAGFDIALAEYIANELGLELEIVPVDFDGVLMELQTKAVDLGVAGLSPDPKRESIMDFSDI